MTPKIGLEIHVQLKTQSKLFCPCSSSSFGAQPNSNICPICAGHPGVLPVLNKEAVERALTMGLALHCQIAAFSRFARKNYFYPDLPKNYQISQYEEPLAVNGHFAFFTAGQKRDVRVKRIHVEEDAGKLLHAIGSQELDYSLVDLNRAGIPLAETVTEPDLTSAQEASDFLTALRMTLKNLEASNCDLEKGEMRVDVNISLSPDGQKLGTKVEIKNLNSFKAVRDALEHEMIRQKEVLEGGGKVIQETRLWDVKSNTTRSMRVKEEASDYRYFPEPDLTPLEVPDSWIEAARQRLEEAPTAKLERYQKDFGLAPKEAQALVFNDNPGISKLFEQTLNLAEKQNCQIAPKTVVNWILNELLAHLKANGLRLSALALSPERFLKFLKVSQEKGLPNNMARELFSNVLSKPDIEPEALTHESDFTLASDDEISRFTAETLKTNPKAVEEYLSGKEKAIGALVGNIMRQTQGRVNPSKIQDHLRRELEALKQSRAPR